jgi:hypothetical protein
MLEVSTTILALFVFYYFIGFPEMKQVITKMFRAQKNNLAGVAALLAAGEVDKVRQIMFDQMQKGGFNVPEKKGTSLAYKAKWLAIPAGLVLLSIFTRGKQFSVVSAFRTALAIVVAEYIFFEFYFNKVVIFGFEDFMKVLHEPTPIQSRPPPTEFKEVEDIIPQVESLKKVENVTIKDSTSVPGSHDQVNKTISALKSLTGELHT